MLNEINQRKAYEELKKAEQKRYEDAIAGRSNISSSGAPPKLRTRKSLSEEEIKKLQEDETLRSINQALRKTATGEQRVIGHIQRIDCKSRPIVYTIKTGTETFTLTTKDFGSLILTAFSAGTGNYEVGCDSNLAQQNAVITYRATATPKNPSKGELVAIEFVAENFRNITL